MKGAWLHASFDIVNQEDFRLSHDILNDDSFNSYKNKYPVSQKMSHLLDLVEGLGYFWGHSVCR